MFGGRVVYYKSPLKSLKDTFMRIIKHKRYYFTWFPFWLFLILFFSLSPFIIGFAGSWVTELETGRPCNEGNCSWAAVPWLGLFTLPIGLLILAIYLFFVLLDTIQLFRKK